MLNTSHNARTRAYLDGQWINPFEFGELVSYILMYQIRYGDTHHLFRQTIKPCRYQDLVIFSLDDMGHTDALEIDASMKDAL